MEDAGSLASTSFNDDDCSYSEETSLTSIRMTKKEVNNLIMKDQIEYTMNKTGKSPIWLDYHLMMLNNAPVPFVKCITCKAILSYDSKSGTSHLSRHSKDCIPKSENVNTRQLKLSSSFSKTEHISLSERQRFADLCAEWCARDPRPFLIVEDKGFYNIGQALIDIGARRGHFEFSQLVPCPNTVKNHLKKLVQVEKASFIRFLKNTCIDTFGITLDYWTCKETSDSYLTASLHYYYNTKLEWVVLGTREFKEIKTGENTRQWISNIIYEFKIDEDKINLIFVTDNGTNLVKGFRNDTHLRCACHCLNLAIEYGLSKSSEQLTKMIDSCKKLVAHFKRAGIQKKLDGVSLKQQVSTRLNSLYVMFDSIMINYSDIEVILEERNEIEFLSDVNFGTISDLTEFLKVFKQASEELSADDSPTIHLVVPWYYYLRNISKANSKDSPLMRQFKSYIYKGLEEKIVLTELHYIATFLHPNLKCLNMLLPEEKHKTIQAVKNIILALGIDAVEQVVEEEYNSISKKNRLDVSLQFMNIVKKNDDVVLAYKKAQIPVIDSDECILDWWTTNGNMFTSIQKLAYKILPVPASSATSERIFSSSGRVLEARRSSLEPSNVDNILILRSYLNKKDV